MHTFVANELMVIGIKQVLRINPLDLGKPAVLSG
jgi:hypothetical protein